jgi:hypothetical protein
MPLFTPSRTKWRKWYTSIELVHSDTITSGLRSTQPTDGTTGASSTQAQSMLIPDAGTKIILVLPHDISPSVSVISYFTDRNLTNSGVSGNIAIWTVPRLVRVTTNSSTRTAADGTQIKTVFTANYGGSGNGRQYIVQQTVDFNTCSGFSADGNDPLTLKLIEFQRRSSDATDTSTDSINCTGVYVYEN